MVGANTNVKIGGGADINTCLENVNHVRHFGSGKFKRGGVAGVLEGKEVTFCEL